MTGYLIRAIDHSRVSYTISVSTPLLYDSICTSTPVPYCALPVVIAPEGESVRIGLSGVSISVESARVFVEEENNTDQPKYPWIGD